MAKIWRYVGRGEFVAGVPTRDLTGDEVAELPEDLRGRVENSFLWLETGEDEPERDLPGVGAEIWTALHGAGLTTMADVRAADDATLLGISGIGEKRLAQIRAAVGTASAANNHDEV